MTKLSVNINKIATLRNARGGNVPDVVKVALDCESFGADGITVHPRPVERHGRHPDLHDLRPSFPTRRSSELCAVGRRWAVGRRCAEARRCEEGRRGGEGRRLDAGQPRAAGRRYG